MLRLARVVCLAVSHDGCAGSSSHANVLWVPTLRPIERGEGGATAVMELQHVDARVAQRKSLHNLSA